MKGAQEAGHKTELISLYDKNITGHDGKAGLKGERYGKRIIRADCPEKN